MAPTSLRWSTSGSGATSPSSRAIPCHNCEPGSRRSGPLRAWQRG
jgi:hypothetical protein